MGKCPEFPTLMHPNTCPMGFILDVTRRVLGTLPIWSEVSSIQYDWTHPLCNRVLRAIHDFDFVVFNVSPLPPLCCVQRFGKVLEPFYFDQEGTCGRSCKKPDVGLKNTGSNKVNARPPFPENVWPAPGRSLYLNQNTSKIGCLESGRVALCVLDVRYRVIQY